MKKLLLTLPLVGMLGACTDMGLTTQESNQVAGTVGGAALGALVTPNDPTKGALIGATVGVVAGTLLGHTATPGQCLYQRPDGSQYNAAC